jgi:hypothetical protein
LNAIMRVFGVILRSPFGLIGVVLATCYGVACTLLLLLLALAWGLIGIPARFAVAAYEGDRGGTPPVERFKQRVRDDYQDWSRWMGDAFSANGDVLRWWARGDS